MAVHVRDDEARNFYLKLSVKMRTMQLSFSRTEVGKDASVASSVQKNVYICPFIVVPEISLRLQNVSLEPCSFYLLFFYIVPLAD